MLKCTWLSITLISDSPLQITEKQLSEKAMAHGAAQQADWLWEVLTNDHKLGKKYQE